MGKCITCVIVHMFVISVHEPSIVRCCCVRPADVWGSFKVTRLSDPSSQLQGRGWSDSGHARERSARRSAVERQQERRGGRACCEAEGAQQEGKVVERSKEQQEEEEEKEKAEGVGKEHRMPGARLV